MMPTVSSELRATYPDAHSILKQEVVNKYSLLYTLNGSDPTLSPLLVSMNTSPAHGTFSKHLTTSSAAHIASRRRARNRK